MKVAVVGGGIGGLTIGYYLSQNKQKVYIFEKEKSVGGLARGFKNRNWDWYLDYLFHHLFTSDQEAKDLIYQLGLGSQLFYLRPKTAIFYQGKISQFDSPLTLLTFPYLNFCQKIQAGLATGYLKLLNDWQKLERTTASEWLEKYYGKKAYQILWQPLLEGKFGNQAKNISAVWFWARIKKRSTKLGYLKGGFQVLVDKLAEKININGGKIVLGHEIRSLKELDNFDKVVITVPTQKFFSNKFPPMLGAINLILVLKEKFLTDGTYWLNINQQGFPFVAVVEHTNFVNLKYYAGAHILYIGGYYPQNHRYFKMSKEDILKEFLPYLKKINSNFNFKFSILDFQLSASAYAQPIVPVGYSKILADFKNSLPKNIYVANMQTIYPWDRGINYAIKQGQKTAAEILKKK